MPPMTQITVRIDPETLEKIETLGAAIKPKPLNRSEMINVALKDFVERADREKKKK